MCQGCLYWRYCGWNSSLQRHSSPSHTGALQNGAVHPFVCLSVCLYVASAAAYRTQAYVLAAEAARRVSRMFSPPWETPPLWKTLPPPGNLCLSTVHKLNTLLYFLSAVFTFYGIRYTGRKLHIQKLFSISNIALVVQIIISAEHSNLSFHSIAGWCQMVNLDGMYGWCPVQVLILKP